MLRVTITGKVTMTRDEAIMQLFEQCSLVSAMYQRELRQHGIDYKVLRRTALGMSGDDMFMIDIREKIEESIQATLKRGNASGN